MKRPPWMSRGLWFATRRSRRGRPIAVSDLDEVVARVLGADVHISDLANKPGPLAEFRTHIDPLCVPPLPSWAGSVAELDEVKP